MKEITGSGIFVANGEDDETEDGSANPSANKTGIRMYQVLCFWIQNNRFFYLLFNPILILCFWKLKQATAGISHISFGEEESVSPKKPASLPEVAKQRELSGTMESEDNKLNKQLSDAKFKELSGQDIFAPPPEIKPRPITARTLELKGSIDIGDSHVRTTISC